MRGGAPLHRDRVGLPIGSPVVDHPTRRCCSTPSLAKFLPWSPAAAVIVNDSLIEAAVHRTDVQVLHIRCTALAREAGATADQRGRAGALIGSMGIIGVETARAALCAMVERKHPELLEGNLQAFGSGSMRWLGTFAH
jgi:hypothetical protein